MWHATLKSLLSRKVRLLLSGLAVILGVMFVSGAFVLTDTLGRSFDSLFATAYSEVDVNVQGRVTAPAGRTGAEVRPTVPAGLVDQLNRDSQVRDAVGQVFSTDLGVIDNRTGKLLTGFGQQHFGVNWTGESGLLRLRTGRAPRAPGEVVINAGLATAGGYVPGNPAHDRISVLGLRRTRQAFTVVGVFGYSGGRDSLAGETTIAFTTPVAQSLLLGQPDAFTSINVTAAGGVTPLALRDHLRATLGDRYDIRTGAELTRQQADQVRKGLSFVTYIFLGFAGVALFVGMFLILNTFSIIIAQRTRELALMRALGASRRQLVGSVLTEAATVGLISSAVGLAAGIGVGALFAAVFGHLGGAKLPLAGVGVPASAVIAAFGVGLGVTIVAALVPALRASRVPPVAAMADVATPDRPLTRLSVAGAALLAAGAVTLAVGLTGNARSATLGTIVAGVAATFVGVTLLTPLVARPAVSAIGRLLAWRVPGELGRRNSARNPRRTAITAGALMVSVALVTAISTVYMSAQRTVTRTVETGLRAELVVAGVQTSQQPPSFDAALLDRMRQVPGVARAVGLWQDAVQIDGQRAVLTATDDLPALVDLTRSTGTAGTLGDLSQGRLVVDDQTAGGRRLSIGSSVVITPPRGEPHVYLVVGVYRHSTLLRGFVVPAELASQFRDPNPTMAFLKLAPGADTNRVRNAVNAVLADNPEVTAQDRSGYVRQQTGLVNSILTMIQLLLLLAMVIAVLGVINTLVLSVIERTREIGLLRAIGLRRGQAAAMITVESIVISVFGALLGTLVGAGLGAAVVRALRDKGIGDLVLPSRLMVGYLVAAALVGVVAAIIPAARAARLSVLDAISYE